jgi:hypothetical protein
MRTREEHLQWCKDRALEYWRAGDLESACASMVSDLNKHEEAKNFNNWFILGLGIIYVTQGDYAGMKRWIEGFR